jgi:hypothetical protein
MASTLNVFKTVTANLATSSTSVYSTPSGYASVVLMAQVSNITSGPITTTAYHVRSGVPSALIQGGLIPSNDALNLLTGRLILQSGDSLSVFANASSSGQLILSVLETAI